MYNEHIRNIRFTIPNYNVAAAPLMTDRRTDGQTDSNSVRLKTMARRSHMLTAKA